MNEIIDIYCERTGPGLLAEPLNFLTNAAFLLAAFLAWRLARRDQVVGWESLLLIGLMASIGIGSALFHSFATLWAMLADTLPILFFQIVFVNVYGRRVMGLCCWRNSALLALFLVMVAGVGMLPQEWLNGSISYAPALLFIAGLSLYHLTSGKRKPYALLAATGLFSVSLTFRSVDMAVCSMLPVGVHFFWHLLNAGVLYLALHGLFANMQKREQI